MLDAHQTTNVRSPGNGRAGAVKVGLIQEEDKEPGNASENSTDPETPAPSRLEHNERGDERPQIRAQDHKELNVIDNSRMLVEEEEILDPHQRPPLAYAAEEAIDNASREIGVETRGGGRPDAGADPDALEEERDGQAPEKTGEGDDEEATRSEGEELANHGALYRCLR